MADRAIFPLGASFARGSGGSIGSHWLTSPALRLVHRVISPKVPRTPAIHHLKSQRAALASQGA